MKKWIALLLALCMTALMAPAMAESTAENSTTESTAAEGGKLDALLSLFGSMMSQTGAGDTAAADGAGDDAAAADGAEGGKLDALLSLFGGMMSQAGAGDDAAAADGAEGGKLDALLSLFGGMMSQTGAEDAAAGLADAAEIAEGVEGVEAAEGVEGTEGAEAAEAAEGAETDSFDPQALLALLRGLGGGELPVKTVPAESKEQFFGTWTLSKAFSMGTEKSPEEMATEGSAPGPMTIEDGKVYMDDAKAENVDPEQREANAAAVMELVDGALKVTDPTENVTMTLYLTEDGGLLMDMVLIQLLYVRAE